MSQSTLNQPAISTVNRSRNYEEKDVILRNTHWTEDGISLFRGNSLDFYDIWNTPNVIVSDGGYGVLGFAGDTHSHQGLADWYEPHIAAWSKFATPQTTLWFWNSEIGWAAVHPVLEKFGWEYINCNIWNKGKGHIAGNVNTSKIRRFPVVTELCVQYAFKPKINGLELKKWLLHEWKRTGLPLRKANEACGVKDAAVRKYLDQGHLWYFPPPETFEKLVNYANSFGEKTGRPYFSIDGIISLNGRDWEKMRYKFHCPHGYTNVWERNSLRGTERIKSPLGNQAAHLNQKPLDLMRLIIEASSDEHDTIWEPFGGLFSAALASKMLKRKAFGAEIDSAYFSLGVERFQTLVNNPKLFTE